MTQRMDPVLVEKAAKALYGLHPFDINRPYTTGKRDAEAVIRVVFDELGLHIERRPERVVYDGFFGEGEPPRVPAAVRYVSPWRLVEQGDTDGD